MELAKTFLVKPVPNVDHTVRASSGKSVVDAVESDGVDWMNDFHAALFDSVTLESVLFTLNFRIEVKVLDSCATLDGAQDESLPVGKASESSSFELQARFTILSSVHASEIPNADSSARGRYDQPVTTRVQ